MPLPPIPLSTYNLIVTFDNLDGETVDLPNPELGDNEIQSNFTSNNISLQGGISIFKNTNAPKNKERELFFKNIKESIVLSFRDFLKNNIGKSIQYTDMDNVDHNVIIIDPETITFEEITDMNCRYFNFTVRLLESL